MKILITAGATWVKIDQVRILTNVFTGKTGLSLAKSLKDKGYSVTLLVNPHCLGEVKGIKTVYYRYFPEFEKAINKLLKRDNYAAIIHTAAVSDYRLKSPFKGKFPSGKKVLKLELEPTQKIIKSIRRLAKKAKLIQFKLETQRKGLLRKAYKSLQDNNSDFVVANALEDINRKYKCFLLGRAGRVKEINSKLGLVKAIDNLVKSK